MEAKPKKRRGRPQKEKPAPAQVSRRVGRPEVGLLADSDRYWQAMFMALTVHGGMKARPASRLVAAYMRGENVDQGSESPDFAGFAEKHNAREGGVLLQFRRAERPFASTATLSSKADAVREKARRSLTAEEDYWLRAMADAFFHTFRAESAVSKYTVALIAQSVGEQAFFANVLCPMIDAKIGPRKSVADVLPCDVEREILRVKRMALGQD